MASRTRNHVLGIGLESRGLSLVLGLESHGLGLEGFGLDYMHVKVISRRVWFQCIQQLIFSSNSRFSFAYFTTLFAWF